jgi:UTP--glucose-1-phosphate uridylyltransferase
VPETQHVKTAVIAAAGSATRMWPASKVIPKELFPLGKVPAIVHLISELADAEITQVILTVSEKGADPMRMLFDGSIEPPASIAGERVAMQFQSLLEKVTIHITVQAGHYGNATPLIQAADRVGSQPCIYAFGDDVVLGENTTKGLINLYRQTGNPVLAAQAVPEAKKVQFGILECQVKNGIQYVSRMLEKPRPEETASNLASFGRYLVTPALMERLLRLRPGKNNEIWFADSVIGRVANGEAVCALPLSTGTWYTVGDPHSYAEAVAAAYRETFGP